MNLDSDGSGSNDRCAGTWAAEMTVFNESVAWKWLMCSSLSGVAIGRCCYYRPIQTALKAIAEIIRILSKDPNVAI